MFFLSLTASGSGSVFISVWRWERRVQPYWVLHRAQARQTSKTTEKTRLYVAFTFVSYQPRPRRMHLEAVWNLTLRLDPFPVHASASRYLLQKKKKKKKKLQPCNEFKFCMGTFPFFEFCSFLLEAGDWPVLICTLHMHVWAALWNSQAKQLWTAAHLKINALKDGWRHCRLRFFIIYTQQTQINTVRGILTL